LQIHLLIPFSYFRYKLEGHTIDEAMINFPDKEKLIGHNKLHYDSLLWSVDFSSDGKMLASTGTDSKVFVWDVETGEKRFNFSIPNDGSAVCFVETPQGRRLAAASAPHMTVTLFDVGDNPQTIAVLGGHSGWVMGIAFSSDGSRLTSASRDKTIRVWDIRAAEKLKEIRFHSERCWCVAYSDDGRWLASASDDFKVGILSLINRNVCFGIE
jgi:WD40 repeat protein